LTNYIIPTTLDTPRIDVVIVENPYKDGPFGAKGVGEMPIDGPAPAVVNALRNAGYDLREIPCTAERVMNAAIGDADTRRGRALTLSTAARRSRDKRAGPRAK
jgi:CO/xanthine dehydrogenase Mo-binding subunit